MTRAAALTGPGPEGIKIRWLEGGCGGPRSERGCVRYLISYDIGDDRRRRRVVKRLKRCAHRLQYSVFEGEFTAASQRRLWRELVALIDLEADGLLMAPLCAACEQARLEAGTTSRLEIEESTIV